MTDDHLPTRTEGEGETVDMPEGLGSFAKGQILGERYQILEMLGRGGMGEVWKAFDLKLRVEVALKALREELFKSERRLELLRQEVRAAREVVSPNVCRIFDLIEIEGRELVSMEYVDGATLLGVLQERGPLELKEAQDIASQFLAGLEAIHKAGLVHRDIKPENIMLTRAGRVVVMDFGLARQETEGGGSVSGTPAYMAPEQAAGQTLDARADVYSAGVVLAEMVSPEGIKSYESRQSVWEGVRSEPAKLPDSPWAPAIKKAVARDRERRYNTAHTLTRALEDVTLRVEGAEDLHPYPGLASFTESDAEYFFGREAEVEQMWRKLDGPPRMLGLVGPSGAGKSSFIKAGLLAAAPPDRSYVVCTPGNAAISSLGRAMAGEMAGDKEAFEQMMDFDNPDVAVEVLSRWRGRHDRALLVVDQFEELFTQNSPDEQRHFPELLSRLVLEADVFVVLSMRDDFLMRCRDQEALKPIFADMTALPTLSGDALRRALVQPATKCGYRFEDDALVDEMLAEVEGERGALPLLAFAAARLWEMRDRDTGLLTRQAYKDIGGVGGALARHAEATIERIGSEHIGIVRELFRNLVTAEGTRAVREWNELLSVFGGDPNAQTNVGAGFTPARDTAEDVLRELIDARLLTSYEVREDEHEPIRRVEIIHESLLANWPRLVRWQTQDQDGAQIRDELRQSARSWDEHGRHDDRLWTGTAFREFQLWRERYSGGLTETEEKFAQAMTSLATRRRRRRRIAAAAGVAILLTVLAIFFGLWRQSVRQTRLAEAQKLLALGQLEIERFPTAALAWAKASLSVADTPEGRLFALEAISKGPLARIRQFNVETEGAAHSGHFSPDGRWIAYLGYDHIKVDHQSGGPTRVIGSVPSDPNRANQTFWPVFDRDSSKLSVWRHRSDRESALVRTYDVPNFEIIHEVERPLGQGFFDFWPASNGIFHVNRSPTGVDFWHLPHGGPWQHFTRVEDFSGLYFDPHGEWAVFQRAEDFVLQSLTRKSVEPRIIGHIVTDAHRFRIDPNLRWIATTNRQGDQISIWPAELDVTEPSRRINTRGLTINSFMRFQIDHQGRRIAVAGDIEGERMAKVWDLSRPEGVEPLTLRNPDVEYMNGVSFGPTGRWVVTGNTGWASFWPIPENPPLVYSGASARLITLEFTVDGTAVFVPSFNHRPRLLPVTTDGPETATWDEKWRGGLAGIAMDPEGRFVLMADPRNGGVLRLFLDGSEPKSIEGFDGFGARVFAYDPERSLVAAALYRGSKDKKVIRVVNLDDQSVRILGPAEDAGDGFVGGFSRLEFLPDGSLLSGGKGGIRRWDLEDGASELLYADMISRMDVSSDGRTVVATRFQDMAGTGPALQVDLTTGESWVMPEFGSNCVSCAIGQDSDRVAVSDADGTIRIGSLSGDEPHLLYGHTKSAEGLSFSPDGRLLASGDMGGTVRIWTVPNRTDAPPQTMSFREFKAKLDSFTNLRVVRDEVSSTGWKLEVGPFPGWETVPEW